MLISRRRSVDVPGAATHPVSGCVERRAGGIDELADPRELRIAVVGHHRDHRLHKLLLVIGKRGCRTLLAIEVQDDASAIGEMVLLL
jgi:hypothetical protein